MQIDWNKTVNDIFANKISCPRCGTLSTSVVAGYSRSSSASQYAPRCQECTRKEDCDARKLVVVCEPCAREFRLRARHIDQEGMMTLLMNDCRKDLEDCLEYLADYWQEDLDIDPDDMDRRLEDVAPDVFVQENDWRRHLEEEYQSYQRWFREQGLRIPNAGWRSEYVEEVLELGYSTSLGD